MVERCFAPHCDSSILHAPGACVHCDKYSDWQEYRKVARIAFSGTPEELGTEHLAPCPSTQFRSPEKRDLWYGNVPPQNEFDAEMALLVAKPGLGQNYGRKRSLFERLTRREPRV